MNTKYGLLLAVISLMETLEQIYPHWPEALVIDKAMEIARLEFAGWVVNLNSLEVEYKLQSPQQEVAFMN